MPKPQAYARAQLVDSWDAIVIGSGVGGLTTAALLALAGQRVLVLERHYEPGGFTQVFRRPGWEWDVGVHYIGQVHTPQAPVRWLFDLLSQGRLEWAMMPDVYDRIHIASEGYDLPRGGANLRARLKQYFPGESRALDRYFAAVLSAARWVHPYMAEKLPAWPGWLAWLGTALRRPFLGWARRSTADILAGLTDNSQLKAVLTGQWGDYGLPPRQSSFAAHALVASHYFEGAGYPVGGSSRIAGSILPTVESSGGQVLIQAEVESVVIESGRAVGVRMLDGRLLRAPLIVSNAGAINTFFRLLPPDLSPVQALRTSIRALPASMAHLCLYAGVKLQPGETPPQGTNLWFYAHADHDRSYQEFAQDPSRPLPILYVSFPSVKDPGFRQRYPDRYTLEVVAPVPYSLFQAWEGSRWKARGVDYDQLKDYWQKRLVAELESHLPSLRGRLDYQELSTPLSTVHFTAHPQGQIYGLPQTPERFLLRGLGPRTPVGGLYLTGSDACLSGVAGAAMGGVLAAAAALGPRLFCRAIAKSGRA